MTPTDTSKTVEELKLAVLDALEARVPAYQIRVAVEEAITIAADVNSELGRAQVFSLFSHRQLRKALTS